MSEFEAAYRLARLAGAVGGLTILVLGALLRWGRYRYPLWHQLLFLGVGLSLLGLAHRAVLAPSFGSAAVLLLSFILALVVMVGIFVHLINHYRRGDPDADDTTLA